MKLTISNNTDAVDIRQDSLGMDVGFGSPSPLHKNRGLHIQIKHNKDRETFNKAVEVTNLFSAAPDLLVALEKLIMQIDDKNLQDKFAMSLSYAEVAIRKAKGEL